MKFLGKDFSFCLNVFPGESWKEVFAQIKKYCLEIRNKIVKNNIPFGLGLRLSYKACQTLKNPSQLNEFKDYLDKNNFYVFTINAFPYGKFHNTKVKEKVYLPDWGTKERLNYTKDVLDILKFLLPKNCLGSISSVPVCYGKKLPKAAIENLLTIEKILDDSFRTSQKKIFLGLEPEPDCFLENTNDCLNFFSLLKKAYKKNLKFLGLCFDTCHFALQYEDLKQSLECLYRANIPISKIQISSVLRLKNHKYKKSLKIFDEGVYLHQTRVKLPDGNVKKFKDLPQALENTESLNGEWRVHCHVPLTFQDSPKGFSSTSYLLNNDFFSFIWTKFPHFEIETYTYFILPNYKESEIVNTIVSEYNFVFEKFIPKTKKKLTKTFP